MLNLIQHNPTTFAKYLKINHWSIISKVHPPGWIHCLSEALQTLSPLSTRLSALQIQGTWRPCRAFSNCWLTTSLLPLSTSKPAISEYPVQRPRFPGSVKGYHYHLLDVNRNAQTNAFEGPNKTSAKMWERNWMQWNLKQMQRLSSGSPTTQLGSQSPT